MFGNLLTHKEAGPEHNAEPTHNDAIQNSAADVEQKYNQVSAGLAPSPEAANLSPEVPSTPPNSTETPLSSTYDAVQSTPMTNQDNLWKVDGGINSPPPTSEIIDTPSTVVADKVNPNETDLQSSPIENANTTSTATPGENDAKSETTSSDSPEEQKEIDKLFNEKPADTATEPSVDTKQEEPAELSEKAKEYIDILANRIKKNEQKRDDISKQLSDMNAEIDKDKAIMAKLPNAGEIIDFITEVNKAENKDTSISPSSEEAKHVDIAA